MKDLRESLLDVDDIESKNTKVVFGDLFKLNTDESRGEYLDKQFSAQRVKKLSKVSGTNKDEIIFNGFVKIIQDIVIDKKLAEIDKLWLKIKLQDVAWNLFQYSMIKKNIYVSLFRKGNLVLSDDHLLNVDSIQISLGAGLDLWFDRI